MRIFLLVLLLVLFSCVREDPTVESVGSHYPSAELRGCGKIENGLGICAVPKGTPWSSLSLAVQGYFEGTVRIVSQQCEVDTTLSFTGGSLIQFPVFGNITRSCLFSVVMSPTYPFQRWQAIQVYGLSGHFAVKALEAEEEWHGFSKKVSGNWVSRVSVPIEDGDVNIVADGCGKFNTVPAKASGGFVEINLHDLVAKRQGACVLDGAVMGQERDVLFNAIISQYDPAFVPLAIPVVSVTANNLSLEGDDTVSMVGVDSDNRMTYKSLFGFDPAQDHIVRMVTVKGRSVIGIYSKGVFTWKQ